MKRKTYNIIVKGMALGMLVVSLSGCGSAENAGGVGANNQETASVTISSETVLENAVSPEGSDDTRQELIMADIAGCYYLPESYDGKDRWNTKAIVLRENGEAVVMQGKALYGSWSLDGSIILKDVKMDPISFDYQEGRLYLKQTDVYYEGNAEEYILPEFVQFMETGDLPAWFYESDGSDFITGYFESGEDYVKIEGNADGSYSVEIFFFRLASFEIENAVVTDNGLEFASMDPAGNPISGVIYFEDDASLTVEFTDADWAYIKTGDRWRGFQETEETLVINPLYMENFDKQDGYYNIKDNTTGVWYVLDNETEVCQGVSCYTTGSKAVTWMDRYLHDAMDLENEDVDLTGSGFGMGDMISIEVTGNHIDKVLSIEWWD